ncbi:MAG: 2-hydroxyacid dehydrogenase, partial [Bacteroidia bacterium]
LLIDTVHPALNEILSKKGIVCDLDNTSSKEDILLKIQKYVGIVIRSRFKIDKDFLDKAKHLKFIARAGAGMENIDVPYAESIGIKCVHAPEGNRDAVGEHALAMLLMLFNNLKQADSEVRNGIWKREENRGYELKAKTVGIIGYGNMGSAFAQRLKGFEVEVLVFDKYKKNFGNEFIKESTLEELFEKADVLSLHVPLTDETKYMVNAKFLNSFKKPIYIINTARGKVLNTADLVEGIKNKKVLGACLDVLEYESISFENIDTKKLPEPFKYLIKSDKVILSPHIAGWTFESHLKISEVLAKKILHVLYAE